MRDHQEFKQTEIGRILKEWEVALCFSKFDGHCGKGCCRHGRWLVESSGESQKDSREV
jgi:hypothetical protein